ncbi:hypothetical protein EBI00_02370 [Marinomonas hwangdonensis]|uniref:Uncharacterized protein n=1 Tax=Marinomonas hwangdonensis TaxID=1053647 RepID=A0A3M8QA70_9GAMM|nr:hypothetical protein [Marinomonas hwangdonensis]RNF52966.1 hypothetical protein EBI00_02370 [Marinomonas hwangdonensis]
MSNGIYQDQSRYPQNTAQQNHSNPFNQAPPQTQNESANTGSIAIEQQRAIAEARGQIQLAKMFPRSNSEALSELVEACKNWDFAKSAFYSVPNRGSGPSIRFAEEVARCYGNFEYGHRELSRSKGKSEIEVFAWDKEKNNVSKRQITVEHIRDTKTGPKPLRDQADIDNRIANVASKQMRGRILAIVPKTFVEMGLAECRKTLAGNNTESMSSKISQMIVEFGELGIRPDQITAYIGHNVDDCSVDDLTELFGVFNAIKQGARVSDYFGGKEESQTKSTSLKSSLKTN